MNENTYLRRHRTPESLRFDQYKKRLDKHISDASLEFLQLAPKVKPLAVKAKKEFPGRSPDAIKKRKKLLVQLLKQNRSIKAFLRKFILPEGSNLPRPILGKIRSWTEKVLYQFRDVLLDRSYKITDALPSIEKHARWGFEAQEKAKKQENIRDEILHEDIISHLPKNIVINLDDNGRIKEFSEILSNEFDTIEVKAKKMKNLIERYNEVASKVKSDLNSNDEMTQLSAIITSIIMETGIRPGKTGQRTMKTVDGESIPIETFGAITLGPEHVSFVRDNFATLQFPGKKGQINIAHLSDPQVISALKSYTDKAQAGDLPFIFVTSEGEQYDYKHYQRYFREEVLSEFTASDFRKLKATEAVLDMLRSQQKDLYAKIRKTVKESSGDAKEEIFQKVRGLVAESVIKAYHEAHIELSHENVSTTVNSYVNPEILLRYLNQGFIEDKIEDVLLGDRPFLSFNVQAFIDEAQKYA